MERERIKEILKEGSNIRLDESWLDDFVKAIGIMRECYKNGGKILICGNGGSVSQAEHFAGELVGKFEKEGRALPCIPLTNIVNVTAIGNDYGFAEVFSRQVEAFGERDDVLISLTTSDYNESDGHSMNIKRAIDKSKEMGLKTIGLFSVKSEKIGNDVDVALKVNAKNTARIQELHITILHMIALFLEEEFR